MTRFGGHLNLWGEAPRHEQEVPNRGVNRSISLTILHSGRAADLVRSTGRSKAQVAHPRRRPEDPPAVGKQAKIDPGRPDGRSTDEKVGLTLRLEHRPPRGGGAQVSPAPVVPHPVALAGAGAGWI